MTLPRELEVRIEIAREHESTLAEMQAMNDAAVALVIKKAVELRGEDWPTLGTALAMYTKACKTHRSIEILCRAGLTSDATVLLRVLSETTVALHFVLKRHSRVRSRLYGVFEMVQTVKAGREMSKTKA